MRVGNAHDLGRYLRGRRRSAGLSQTDLATQAAVSRRWLADLESGKPTVELGLVFRVIAALGLELDCRPAPTPQIDLDAYLDSLGGDS
jgi:HTH-type transcriptional regulator / antitoxin HipB